MDTHSGGADRLNVPEEPTAKPASSWWRRHNSLRVRNGRMVLLGLTALVVGVGVTLLTAWLGIS